MTVLAIRDVHKTFGGTRALRGVSFDVAPGRIHALLGGNGSGKSTLIKILAGVERADAGAVKWSDRSVPADEMTPALARSLGLRFVHQQSSTFPDLSVAENLFIGDAFPTRAPFTISWRKLRHEATALLTRFGIDVDPRCPLDRLNPSNQTMVAIARALHGADEGEGVLVLDEPTASLPAPEVDRLYDSLRRCAEMGQAILFVTHRLEEVLAVADAITVLRDGQVAATEARVDVDHARLVEMILGRHVERFIARNAEASDSDRLLSVEGLHGGAARGVTLEARPGEIIGIAGLIGSGRTSLLEVLFGLRPASAGQIQLAGEDVTFKGPRDAMRAGVAFVPENRRHSAFADLSVAANLSMAVIPNYYEGGVMRSRREKSDARQLTDEFTVKASDPSAVLSSLSGGNQQKVILARWLRRGPRLLLLDEPTQGVDVGARFEIWELIRRRADQGMSVLVVSSDFEELAGVCDRVLIMAGGRIACEVRGEQLTDRNLELLTLESA